jgi:chloramphenicol 3-O phosphotransferase
LRDLRVLWVGVRCDSAVAAGREVARRRQGHRDGHVPGGCGPPGRGYGLEVDTTHAESMECARTIAAHVS